MSSISGHQGLGALSAIVRRLMATLGGATLALSITPAVEAAGIQVVVPNGSPVQIAVVLDHSGSLTAAGASARNAVQMAVEKHPRIKGFKVQLNHFDGPCNNPTVSAAVATEVVANPQNVAVIGHMCSRDEQAALPIYEQARVVTLSGSATNPQNPAFGPHVFNSVDVPDDVLGESNTWYATVQPLPSDIRWRMQYQQEFGSPPEQFADLYFDAASLMLDEIAATADVKDGNLVIDRASLASAVRSLSASEEEGFKGVTCSITLDNRGYRVNDPGSLAECADQDRLVLNENAVHAGDWTYIVQGSGPGAVVDGSQLEVTLPASSKQTSTPGIFSAGVVSRCQVRGDFDIRVNFRLIDWPAKNGVQALIGDGNLQHVVARSSEPSFGQETYLAFFPPNGASVLTSDQSGSLRLSRSGAQITAYYRSDDRWVQLLTGPTGTADAYVVLYSWSADDRFGHQGVKVTFSHFRLSKGELVCP